MKRAVVLALIAVGFVYVVVSQLRDKLNDRFSLAMRADSAKFCLKRNPCTVTLEQFLPGDWDRIYVFSPGTTENEVVLATGKSIPVPQGSRLAFFMHDKAVLHTTTERPEGDDKEDADYHLVDFTGVPTHDHHLMLVRGQLYRRIKGTPCDNCVTLQAIPAPQVIAP